MTAALCCLLCLAAADQPPPKSEPLWPKGAPGAVGTEERDVPTLTFYAPAKGVPAKAAVVICPGGGYGGLAVNHEGKDIGKWLSDRGILGVMLKYRLGPRYRHPAPLQDAQRAVRTVRARAAELGIAPDRIGVWGFSAGGHLASSVGTHYDAGKAGDADPVERVSCRPDFLILAYPVITMTEKTHGGSKKNLLGDNPDPKLVELMSNEKQVTKDTPPTFLFHTGEDKAVVIENSRLFAAACKAAGVPVELVEYEKGVHGVGLAPNDPVLSKWPDKLQAWLVGRGILTK